MPGLPHDGWYNGNVDLMIANGTYDDFRDYLEKHLEVLFGEEKAMEELIRYDKIWNSIPLEKRMENRQKVVSASTPKWVETRAGKKELKAHPSNNGVLEEQFQQKIVPKESNRPAGSLSNDNNPLAMQKEESFAKKPISPLKL